MALRAIGVPSLPLWDTILQCEAVCVFHEDNAAMIQICSTGKNPSMRHMGRTHRVDAHWLHETFQQKWVELLKCGTHKMRADIFTKGFETLDKWAHALHFINHVDPNSFFSHRPGDEVITFEPDPTSVTGGLLGRLCLLLMWRPPRKLH